MYNCHFIVSIFQAFSTIATFGDVLKWKNYCLRKCLFKYGNNKNYTIIILYFCVLFSVSRILQKLMKNFAESSV